MFSQDARQTQHKDVDKRPASKSEYCLKHFVDDDQSKESTRVMRKFINSAIYVEKPLSSTVSSENTSICQQTSNEDFLEVKTKRCTCSVDQKTCPCHCNNYLKITPQETKTSFITSSKAESSKTKIKPQNFKISNNTDEEKEMLLRKWIAKKEEEKRRRENEARMALEAKMREREMLLEQKRKNFEKWQENKKKMEMEAKKKKQRQLEKKQIEELEKEKRQLENQLNFQLWVKKKEEDLIEKKIKKQIELISELERKEIQMRENEKAFNEWLKNSKNKRKPVPLNRGLESLRSSTHISYVNPNPWNPKP